MHRLTSIGIGILLVLFMSGCSLYTEINPRGAGRKDLPRTHVRVQYSPKYVHLRADISQWFSYFTTPRLDAEDQNRGWQTVPSPPSGYPGFYKIPGNRPTQWFKFVPGATVTSAYAVYDGNKIYIPMGVNQWRFPVRNDGGGGEHELIVVFSVRHRDGATKEYFMPFKIENGL